MRIYTIGHSTWAIDKFIELLRGNAVTDLIDIRSFPGSKHFPHFNSDTLARSLAASGIRYHHESALGGRRRASANSRNTTWRNVSFRGYADYMETPEFKEAAAALMTLCDGKTCALMCAEALWWRCHRSMVSDYLVNNGVEVLHIVSINKVQAHRLKDPARIENGELTYHPRV